VNVFYVHDRDKDDDDDDDDEQCISTSSSIHTPVSQTVTSVNERHQPSTSHRSGNDLWPPLMVRLHDPWHSLATNRSVSSREAVLAATLHYDNSTRWAKNCHTEISEGTQLKISGHVLDEVAASFSVYSRTQ